MKTRLVLFFLLLSTVPLWAAGPSISPEKPIFQFGEVIEGTKVEHTFRFKNTGDAPLTITKVRSSCGCTAALLSTDVIPPGGSGEVRTVFNSSGFSGPVAKTIYLHTNDPVQKMVRFQLKGQVQKEIVLNPARLRLSNLKRDKPVEVTILLTNKGQDPIFLSELKSTSKELTANLSANQVAPGETVKLTLTLVPSGAQPRFAGYITLRTSSPRMPLLRIPVTGNLIE